MGTVIEVNIRVMSLVGGHFQMLLLVDAMSTPMVDLRSDTVTKPTASMRSAMAAANVGDVHCVGRGADVRVDSLDSEWSLVPRVGA